VNTTPTVSPTGVVDNVEPPVAGKALDAGGLLVSKRIDLEFELEAVLDRSAP
jgi:hypothetical protein